MCSTITSTMPFSLRDGEGDKEVIAEVLRPGYLYNGSIIQPAMVKVTKG